LNLNRGTQMLRSGFAMIGRVYATGTMAKRFRTVIFSGRSPFIVNSLHVGALVKETGTADQRAGNASQHAASTVLTAATLFICLGLSDAGASAQIVVPYPGIINTLAGLGEVEGYSGDGGLATKAEMYLPWAVAVDAVGDLYIADSYNNRIRKVAASTGDISTVAGNGTAGYSGNGGPATSAELYYPFGVALDASGNIYIADTQNNRVRMVCAGTTSPIHGTTCPAAGDIILLAGVSSSCSYSGNGAPATSAGLCGPRGLVVSSSGNLYFSDYGNYVVREVDASTGDISTVAGDHTQGASGNDGAATSAELSGPNGLALDSSGNLYIADNDVYGYDDAVRKVTASTGIISLVAGVPGESNGVCESGVATSVPLGSPEGVAVDASGNVYIADYEKDCIFEVTASTGDLATLVGPGPNGAGYSGDGGPATNAELNAPADVTLDSSGNLYIADAFNDVIRAVGAQATAQVVATMTFGSAGNSSAGTAPQRKNLTQCYTSCSSGSPQGGPATAYCTTMIQNTAEMNGCSAYGTVPTLTVTNPGPPPNGTTIESGNGAGGSDTPSALSASYGTSTDDSFCTSDPYRNLASGFSGLTLPGCVADSTATLSQTTSGTSTDSLFPTTWVVSGSSHNADLADHYVRESWWSIPCSTYDDIEHVEYDTNYSAGNGQYYGWGLHWSKDAPLEAGGQGQMFQYDPQGGSWRTLQFNPVGGGSPVYTIPVSCGEVVHTRVFMHRGSTTACTNKSKSNCFFYDQMYVQNCGSSAGTCANSAAGTLYNLVDAITGAIPGGIPLDLNWTAYEPDLQVQIDTQASGTASVIFDSDSLVIYNF